MRALAWAVGVSLVAAPLGAATVCVKPSGAGGCQATIQGAVTAAAAGDVVLVSPGVYNENVVVPAGKDGLQIVGVSKLTTILDPDAPLTGVGIIIQSDSVQVRNLTVRSGAAAGIIVQADSVLIQGVRLLGMRAAGGFAVGCQNGTTGHRILANEIRGVAGIGIYLVNANTGSLVQGNLVTQVAGTGIVATGDDIRVLSNRVLGAGSAGVIVAGDRVVVTGNVVEGAVADGLLVTGREVNVSANSLLNAGALTVNCTGGPSPCSAIGNTSVGSSSYGAAFNATGAHMRVQRHRVSGAAAQGLLLDGKGIEASLNVATDTGRGANGHCVETRGIANTLTQNSATRCGASGFYVSGDELILNLNTATAAGVSGFVVDGNGGAYADTVLTHNRATGNNGQGFAVIGAAVNTELTGNTALSHRTDFCDVGTGTVASGNTFGSSSVTCQILN